MIFRLQLALWLGLFSEKLWVQRKTRRVDGAWPPACAAGGGPWPLQLSAVSVSRLLLGVCLVFATTGFSCNIYVLPGVGTLTVWVLLMALGSIKLRVTGQGQNDQAHLLVINIWCSVSPWGSCYGPEFPLLPGLSPPPLLDTLLMEASFFPWEGCFSHAALKSKQPPLLSSSPSPQKGPLLSSPSKHPLKVAAGLSKQVLVLPQKDFRIWPI